MKINFDCRLKFTLRQRKYCVAKNNLPRLWRESLIKELTRLRQNGTKRDLGSNQCLQIPGDGGLYWIGESDDYIYGQHVGDGDHEYEIGYEAGKRDKACFSKVDGRYLQRLLRRGILHTEEPAVHALYKLDQISGKFKGADIRAWWHTKVFLPNIGELLESAQKELRAYRVNLKRTGARERKKTFGRQLPAGNTSEQQRKVISGLRDTVGSLKAQLRCLIASEQRERELRQEAETRLKQEEAGIARREAILKRERAELMRKFQQQANTLRQAAEIHLKQRQDIISRREAALDHAEAGLRRMIALRQRGHGGRESEKRAVPVPDSGAGSEVSYTIDADERFPCPITGEVMRDPVIIADGRTYEREAIETWIRYCFDSGKNYATSPMTGAKLDHLNLTPNVDLRQHIEAYVKALPALRRQKFMIRHHKNLQEQYKEHMMIARKQCERQIAEMRQRLAKLRAAMGEHVSGFARSDNSFFDSMMSRVASLHKDNIPLPLNLSRINSASMSASSGSSAGATSSFFASASSAADASTNVGNVPPSSKESEKESDLPSYESLFG